MYGKIKKTKTNHQPVPNLPNLPNQECRAFFILLHESISIVPWVQLKLQPRWVWRLCKVPEEPHKDKTRGGCETQRLAILVRLYYCFLSCFFTYSTRGKGIRNSGVGDACLHRRKRTYALSSTSFLGGFPAKRETSASLICESSMV